MTENSNEYLPDPDFDYEDSEDTEREPDGYECNCCQSFQAKNNFGGMCNKCDAYALEPIYF
jgi:hypothetical protein